MEKVVWVPKTKWPEDEAEPLSFDAITRPLIKAIKYAYKLERRNKGKSIPWSGPEIGRPELAICLPAKEKLSAKMLAYSEDDQGRDALEEIVGLAVQLGIEQGRRIFRSSPQYRTLLLSETLLKYQSGQGTIDDVITAIRTGD